MVTSLRGNVVFTVQDVLSGPPFSKIDLVSCRNLLIYLNTEAQAKAISLFHLARREGGILMLGSSETIGKADDRFEVIAQSTNEELLTSKEELQSLDEQPRHSTANSRRRLNDSG
ncbi:hypothetical protein BH10PSE15_BH10PSE15_13150 [soil metagenome]